MTASRMNFTQLLKQVNPGAVFLASKSIIAEIPVSYERGTYAETFMSVLPLPCAYLLCNLLYLRRPHMSSRWRYLWGHCLFVLPVTLTMSEFPVQQYLFVTLTFITLTAAIFCKLIRSNPVPIMSTQESSLPSESSPFSSLAPLLDGKGRASCLNVFRGCVYIATCVAILARDLPQFHLDFAKTHNFGTGLMDVGLGCFVLAMGNLSATARMSKSDVNIWRAFRSAVRDGLVLSFCGAVRAAVVVFGLAGAAADEYGKHWNVFFTLAAIRVVGTCTELVVPTKCPPILIGILIGLVYELALLFGLARYIIQPNVNDDDSRASGLFAANREGICSLIGLLGLYFWGIQIGQWINQARTSESEAGFCHLLRKFIITFIICAVPINFYRWVIHREPFYVFMESRRMGNMAYTLWMVSYETFLTGFALITELLVFKYKFKIAQNPTNDFESYLFYVDRYGLAYFLLGNLLTGAVNWVIIKPARSYFSDMPGFSTPIILNLYMLVLPLGAERLSKLIKL